MSETDDGRLAKLEAVLYASGRPLSLATLCAHLKLNSEMEVSDLLHKLSEIYERDGSPLEIKELPERRVVLQLKPDYTKQARRFSTKPLLTAGPLRTLSYVAYHQPVEQKQVAEARGSQAYRHLKMLEEMGLISRERKGRATIIQTTPDFADYLGLSRERASMKRQLRRLFKKLELNQMEKR
ncbi:hypothetical protein DRO42_07135 [Candidatus Bathyarchaeota archaeon]|nr:MAG: hypothetical protein DRO42_07135 [Candidatus Bathyarchaeota archaeon]